MRLCVLWFVMAVGSAAANPPEWNQARPGRVWAFPRDHYAHADFKTEWWYVTGVVEDADAREFGYQMTWFRIGLRPNAEPERASWSSSQLVMAHSAIIDLDTGERAVAEVLHRVHPILGGFGSPPESTLVWCVGRPGTSTRWSMSLDDATTRQSSAGRGERFFARGGAIDGDNGLSLALTATRPRVLQGDGGYSRKSREGVGASHYYTHTRLATEGTLRWRGRDLDVRGVSWLDREFSSGVLADDQVGWDWVSVRLLDGRDLTAYQLRDAAGETNWTAGSLVGTDGVVRSLDPTSLTFDVVDRWTSPQTGARYPTTWTITVEGERFEVSARFDAQENASEEGIGIAYWEGVVTVRDATGAVAGEGFLEMTGYDPRGSRALLRGLR